MFFKKEPKVFCIGANKTGTTSLEKALSDLGYKLGDQDKAQDLIEPYRQRDFKKIVDFCKTADAFQDAPFSYHYTFMFLDEHFPNSKFILTERDSAEEWYSSLVRFHSKMFGQNGNIPTVEDLKRARRSKTRSPWDNMLVRLPLKEEDPYNKAQLIEYYNVHNAIIKDYFRFSDKLLVLNLKEKDAYGKFCKFINKKPLYQEFPWENKT
jgi:hypothetical protein